MHLFSAPGPSVTHDARRLSEDGAAAGSRPVVAPVQLPRRLAIAGALTLLLAACGRKANPDPPEGTPKGAFPKSYPPKGS
jgi:Prokaryotic lipoprotein-attachment site